MKASIATFKHIARRLLGLDYIDDVALPPTQRYGLRLLYYNGALALFSEAAINNYTNLFLVALRASNAQIGLLGTLSQAFAALAPLPAALLAERSKAYRLHIVLPNFIARLGFILLAALPLLPLGQFAAIVAIWLLAGRAFATSWSTAPWTAFVGQLVPLELRARYFAARNFLGGLATITGTLIAGQVISTLGFPLGYQVVFILSLAIGLAASWTFWRIPAPPQAGAGARDPVAQAVAHWFSQIWEIVSPRHIFGRYLWCGCALAFAVNIGGPFIQVYQVRELGFAAGTIGILVSLEQVVNILAQRVYGTFVFAKLGELRAMKVLRFSTALVPLAWIFVRDPLAAVPVVMLAGTIWSGHELANFNNVLRFTPEHRRASFVAVQTFAVSVCAAAGPALGGVLSELIGYQALFGLSAVLRVLAAAMLVALVR